MQELTFETILRLPQMELKKRLKAELKSRGYPVTDKPGYLYAEGTIPVLLVAHMDTVHRQPVEQVCYSADGAVARSAATKRETAEKCRPAYRRFSARRHSCR